MKRGQQGITLVVSLIMLVLMTLMALSSFNIGKGSLQIVNNAQQQALAQSAAQSTIDGVVSSPSFVEAPGAVLDNSSCPTGLAAPPNSRCVDLYGDGKSVVVVTLQPQPTCTQVKLIPAASLNLTQTEDLGCALGEQQNFGVEGVVSGASLCSDSLWEINAAASEPVSRAAAVVTQGVSMRVSNDSVSTTCP
jgi:Tfp pilus assembly protein PilX